MVTPHLAAASVRRTMGTACRVAAIVSVFSSFAPAAEIVTITPELLAPPTPATPHVPPPDGKEADWILGDHVLRNDRIAAVIARPVAGRNANMTVRTVGGCVIDLTPVGRPDDQLGCFYPGDGSVAYRFVTAGSGAPVDATGRDLADADAPALAIRGERVFLVVRALAEPNKPQVDVSYSLADGDDFLTVTSTYRNPHDEPITVDFRDLVRADRTFTTGFDPSARLLFWDDEFFSQSYGIMPIGGTLDVTSGKPPGSRDPVRYRLDGETSRAIPPGERVVLTRRLVVAGSLLALRTRASRLADLPVVDMTISVDDPSGPAAGALVTVMRGDVKYGAARTDSDGIVTLVLPRSDDAWTVSAATPGRTVSGQSLGPVTEARRDVRLSLPAPAIVAGTVSDGEGSPVPCKVQFRRRGGGEPEFGPDSGHTAVRNLRYTHTGRFRQEVPPGTYDVIVSRGPEYDAETLTITAEPGRETPLVATLRRVVDTTGWVSTDYHSHSSPSGDNTSSQLGRVENLLCEHIEFAPCTEHNRISSYVPHLHRLGVADLMATCSGMELTGSLLPVNHQNAFPLLHRPHTQDGGGPQVDNDNPQVQIERLALWDAGREKVVQMNHPNLVQILGDRDTDGSADAGFEGMFGFVDVIEVHPPGEIFGPVPVRDDPRKKTSTIFTWLQMLNLGYRVPGVVNTDAHSNFHGSGWLRNYVRSSTDDPARIAIGEMVQASKHGRVVMTNGPFLEVRAAGESDGRPHEAGPGDELDVDDGRVRLNIRVQCPNWLDVDRVQVFLNGRAVPELSFTRRDHGTLFSPDVVRFAHEVPLVVDRDAHVVVATIGEGATLGDVMGPEHAGTRPVAVANPIFIDLGGDGFVANLDLLGLPIPHQAKPTHRHHGHAHPRRHDHD